MPLEPTRANIVWLVIYLATMLVLGLALTYARGQAIASLSSPRALAEWRAWKRAEEERQEQRAGPVARRAPKSDEPPALVLLRDGYPGILAACLLIGTVLFGFLMLAARGIARSAATRRGSE